jgi:hypothetical protein
LESGNVELKMLKLKKFLILSLGMTSLFGAAAFANEEQSARAGEAILQEMLKPSVAKEAPRTRVSSSPLIVYRHSTGGTLGLAAEVTEIARYKNYLFVYNGYGHGPQVIAYFSAAGAARDMARIKDGESIDATRCMVHDAWLSTEPSVGGDPLCQAKTFSLKMDCDEATMVPLMTGIQRGWYQMTDIESPATQPQTTEVHCTRDHGGKY